MKDRLRRAQRALRATVVMLLLAAGIIVATAAPAQAIGSCWTGNNVGCWTSDINSSGSMQVQIGQTQGCRNATAAQNDKASWVGNNVGSGYLMRFWVDGNCSWTSFYLVPGTSRNLHTGAATFNDEISSWAVYPCAAVYEC